MGNAKEKTAVKIEHAQKFVKGAKVIGRRKSKNGLDFEGQRTKTDGSNMMVEKINLRNSKGAFGRVDVKAVSGQHFKDLLKMEMFSTIFAENQNVIKVDNN
jgi:hypothetical protein